MRGRKPKPTHIKAITGNPGKRKLNDDEPLPEPAVPDEHDEQRGIVSMEIRLSK